jgi:hypothetical protein
MSNAAQLRAHSASQHYDHLLKLLLIGDSGARAREARRGEARRREMNSARA